MAAPTPLRVTIRRLCAVCGNADPEAFRVHHQRPAFRMMRCLRCGFLFIPPEYRKALDYSEYKPADVARRVARADLWIKKERNRLRYDAIRRDHPSGSVLDIGCGFGHFLLTGMELGYRVRGVEMCRANAAFVRAQFGIPVWEGDFLEFPETERYDVVTLWDTLEHMDRPNRVVAKAARLLAPGGILVIQVPQVDSFFARLLGERWWAIGLDHANYFSRKTLPLLLAGHGLKAIRIRSSIELKNVLLYVLLPALARTGRKRSLEASERQEAFNRLTRKSPRGRQCLVRMHHAVYRLCSFLQIGDEMVVVAKGVGCEG
jgi:2-polyprenyl-3-methyl-5-hydroxy-6-metoxy-1,4-benzoquinol methylase